MSAAQEARTHRWVRRLSLPGIVLAGWLAGQSLAPSLLARSWVFQGVLSGMSVVLGYWAGTTLSWCWRAARRRGLRRPASLTPAADLRVRVGVVAATVAYVAWSAVGAVDQHRWTWDRLGYERSSFWYVYGATLVLTVVVAALLLLLGLALAFLWRRATRVGTRMLPAWIAGGLAFVLVAWVALASLNTFVLQRTLDGLNVAFELGDRDLDGAPAPPTSRVRSGGPESEVAWDEAGREGRRFLTQGPDPAELAELAPGEVVEPVRVFVGRASADTVAERVDLAMAELERFGGFDRAAVLVVVPTGTGWVNEQLVQPLEYFHGGDIATVAVQYSHLPSPLAFVAEADASADTATALVEAVEARLARTTGDRPDLYVAGESLGSVGGSHAFASLADSLDRVDGAVWVGPPETMRLRREAERVREPGSPQIRPVVGDGRDVLFANRDSDLTGRTAHSVFLQQGDDAIVWWDWDTAWRRPDWLEEPLDPAVNPAVSWTPVTTFLQLAVDMAVSTDFDEGHGHTYGTQPLSAWHAVVRAPGWDQERVETLRRRLAGLPR